MMKSFWLFIGIQVGWLAAVVGAASGYPWSGPIVIALVLGFHIRFSTARLPLVATSLVFGLVGYAADGLLVVTGVLAYPPEAVLGSPGSLWMAALWMNLAPVFPALEWPGDRWGWMSLVGLVAGPVAYLGGQRLGAVTFPLGNSLALIGVGVEWMLAAPVMLWVWLQMSPRRSASYEEAEYEGESSDV